MTTSKDSTTLNMEVQKVNFHINTVILTLSCWIPQHSLVSTEGGSSQPGLHCQQPTR